MGDSGDAIALVGGQIDCGTAHILRSQKPAEGNARQPLASQCFRVCAGLNVAAQGGRIGNAGAKAIDSDVVAAIIECQRFGEQHHGALGGNVTRGQHLAGYAADRTHVQDRSATLFAHDGHNVLHAKDILSLLMFQAGSSIDGRNTDGVLQSALSGSNNTAAGNGSEAALSFYTQFADPAKNIYSWNTALPLSRDAFTAGDLALYFGYASELNNLYTRNPNLNFDVALMPQSQSSIADVTYGEVYGLSILKSSSNVTATANAIVTLASSAAQTIWSSVSGYPPVTRDLLAVKPTGPFMPIFYTAALQSQGWLDPNRSATDAIFKDMVESVLSGNKGPAEAVQDGNGRLSQLLNTLQN